jgi:hypothetical protein
MTILHLLVGVGSGLLVVIGLVVKKAIEVAIEKEYASWAPPLARRLVQLAGVLCPSMRRRWLADIKGAQDTEGRSALYEATSCLLCAPYHAARHAGRKAQTALFNLVGATSQVFVERWWLPVALISLLLVIVFVVVRRVPIPIPIPMLTGVNLLLIGAIVGVPMLAVGAAYVVDHRRQAPRAGAGAPGKARRRPRSRFS